ncbi:hypothetical protein [Cellulosimicrobium arenosum]|uniref:Uncharacterized protein n=1 Tax=Cellulosimicrobium arenosum TaxID=2708133 RepID=A0A927GAM3_9MICO|nr:hypothetical protein [Cellulosimicrobium arenosum]MBD8079155.1 hypothetical protein [Cellulosimicrobium arenosum]
MTRGARDRSGSSDEGPERSDGRFGPGAHHGDPAWPTYPSRGGTAPRDPLRSTLDAELRGRSAPSSATSARPAAPVDPEARPGPASGSARARPLGFWSGLRTGFVPGAGGTLLVLLLAGWFGLGPQSPVVTTSYSVAIVVGFVLTVVCVVGWVTALVRRPTADDGSTAGRPRTGAFVRAVTRVLGLVIAVLVVTPLWVGFRS